MGGGKKRGEGEEVVVGVKRVFFSVSFLGEIYSMLLF